MVCLWRSVDKFLELGFLLLLCAFLRPGDKHLYPLSHLTGPGLPVFTSLLCLTDRCFPETPKSYLSVGKKYRVKKVSGLVLFSPPMYRESLTRALQHVKCTCTVHLLVGKLWVVFTVF